MKTWLQPLALPCVLSFCVLWCCVSSCAHHRGAKDSTTNANSAGVHAKDIGSELSAKTGEAAESAATLGSERVRIRRLKLDPNKEIRIKGIISEVVAMRLVPPVVVFKVGDGTGEVVAVINEQKSLREGTSVDLVGKYLSMPSPSYSGPDKAPDEPVFVVSHFFEIPTE